MASVHRREGTKNWRAVYYGPGGRRLYKSTGTPDRRKALQIAHAWERAAGMGTRMTEQAVRRVMADMFQMVNAETLPASSIRDYLASWMKGKSVELAESSFTAYEQVIREFLGYLGGRADLPVDAITARDVAGWRDAKAETVTPTTANRATKILRIAFADAVRLGLAQENTVDRVRVLKTERSRARRRAFTLGELRRVYEASPDPWRGMILFGLYTGQRLMDCASATWNQIDLTAATWTMTQAKTGERLDPIPLHDAVLDWLATRPTNDDPNARVFSEFEGMDGSTVSRGFHNILASLGLVKPWDKKHGDTGKGRSARRAVNELSFHALRHTSSTLLHEAGAGEAVAMSITGHKSAAVHRKYVHPGDDARRRAVDSLPDVRAQ